MKSEIFFILIILVSPSGVGWYDRINMLPSFYKNMKDLGGKVIVTRF
jgi:hypothetical protein